MKKRLLLAVFMVSLTLAAAGCGKKETEESTNVSTETTVDEETTDETPEEETEKTITEIVAGLDLKKLVTLGEYKGVEVEKPSADVTEEQINSEIETTLADFPVEVTDRTTVQEGDTVNINYVGRMDGEEFEGGSADNTDLTIGSDSFIEGFEDGLIGASIGDSVVLNLKFPENYTEELSGKDVEFTVTINQIKMVIDEPTDEWVAENLSGLGYTTVEEWKEGIRENYKMSNEQNVEEQVKNKAWEAVMEQTVINEYPEELVARGKEQYISMYWEPMASYSNISVEELVEQVGYTTEEFEEMVEENGKYAAKCVLVCYAIGQEEGMVVGDEAYKQALEAQAEEYSVTSEELVSTYGQDNVEQVVYQGMIMNYIVDQAKVTEAGTEAE